MKISQLRAMGFQLSAAPGAEGCTLLESDRKFAYFNPRFIDQARDVFGGLRVAEKTSDFSHGIVVAGDFHSVSPDAEFPFVILTLPAYEMLRITHERMEEARAEFEKQTSRHLAAVAQYTGL